MSLEPQAEQQQPQQPQPSGAMADCWTCLSRIQVALVLALVQLIFSFYAIVTQWALHHSDDGSAGGDEAKPMNPAVYNVLRDVGCSIVLIVAGRVQSGEFMWPESNDRFIFVLIGVCNVYFGQYFNVLGVTYANALTSSIWQNTIPVFTLIIGLLSGIERIAMRAPPPHPHLPPSRHPPLPSERSSSAVRALQVRTGWRRSAASRSPSRARRSRAT